VNSYSSIFVDNPFGHAHETYASAGDVPRVRDLSAETKTVSIRSYSNGQALA